ncbi:Ppx/GppA family phosphatase [Micrococcales bacterium 31B]|nr:Ppx/GppA family phosphatase [Micrococcales bacterium 31B]
MRLAVLDIGSNTVHLLVVDAHPGAPPWPAASHKEVMRLAEHLDEAGHITREGQDSLQRFVREAVAVADNQGASELLAFATSAIREAPNGADLLERISADAGVQLQVLSGDDEAKLTFLAVRRWCGWSAGRIINLDIGGGSLEIACGAEETPDAALSVPLGSGRFTREMRLGERPSPKRILEAQKSARRVLGHVAGQITRNAPFDTAVGSSKTLRNLAIIMAELGGDKVDLDATLVLRRDDLTAGLTALAARSHAEIARFSRISTTRAPQVVGGAIVAEAALTVLGVESLVVCPWALREGIILRRLDHLDD